MNGYIYSNYADTGESMVRLPDAKTKYQASLVRAKGFELRGVKQCLTYQRSVADGHPVEVIYRIQGRNKANG